MIFARTFPFAKKERFSRFPKENDRNLQERQLIKSVWMNGLVGINLSVRQRWPARIGVMLMVKVSVCGGFGCRMFGSDKTFEALRKELARRGLTDRVELSETFCMGGCSQGPCVRVNGVKFRQLDPAQVPEWVDEHVMVRL